MAEENEELETSIDSETEKPEGHKDDKVAVKQPDAKMYPESYVKKIHNENAARRKREEELSQRLKEFEDKELAAETDLKKKIDALEKREAKRAEEFNQKLSASDRRFVLSEARRIAKDAGIIDIDDVKVIDLSDLRVDDDNVVGLDEKIAALKGSKPHWFKSSESKDAKDVKDQRRTVKTPERKEADGKGKDWSKASDQEFRDFAEQYGVHV